MLSRCIQKKNLAGILLFGIWLSPSAPLVWSQTSCGDFESCLEESKVEDVSTRAGAISRLGRIKDERALPHLIRWAKEDPNLEIQFAAIRSLGMMGDPTSVFVLSDFLGTEPQLQDEAITALIAIGGSAASEALVRALDYETAQIAAIQGLAEIGERKAKLKLIDLYRTSDDERIRGLSSIAIQRIHARWGPTEMEMGVPIYPGANYLPNARADWIFTTLDPVDRVTTFYQKKLDRSPLDPALFKKEHERPFVQTDESLEGFLPERPDSIFVVEEQTFHGNQYPSKIIFIKANSKKTEIQIFHAAGPED